MRRYKARVTDIVSRSPRLLDIFYREVMEFTVGKRNVSLVQS